MKMYSIPENLLTPEQKEWVKECDEMRQKRRVECLNVNNWTSRWTKIMSAFCILALVIIIPFGGTQQSATLFLLIILAATAVMAVMDEIATDRRKNEFNKEFPEWAPFLDSYKSYT